MPQHLTPEEREVISQMWFANHSQTEIAKALSRHRSTISRELARNGSGDEYCGVVAQRKSERRRRERPRIRKLQSAEAQEKRQAEPVAKAACRRLKSLPANLRRTVTFDNRKEFAAHQTISRRLGMNVYFAYPHCPWQRGTNENTNGLARQFFPKKSSIKDYSDHDISRFETLLNERPRRRLGYRTPSETLRRFGVAIES